MVAPEYLSIYAALQQKEGVILDSCFSIPLPTHNHLQISLDTIGFEYDNKNI